MPEVDITIGDRTFQVACQAGEEHFLRAAARLLDNEAQPLVRQMGRLPEARMLLMSALMLADRMAAIEDELRLVKAQTASLQAQAAGEVRQIPPVVLESLGEIAARVEALALAVEERIEA